MVEREGEREESVIIYECVPHKRLLGYDYITTHLVGSISGENVGMIL